MAKGIEMTHGEHRSLRQHRIDKTGSRRRPAAVMGHDDRRACQPRRIPCQQCPFASALDVTDQQQHTLSRQQGRQMRLAIGPLQRPGPADTQDTGLVIIASCHHPARIRRKDLETYTVPLPMHFIGAKADWQFSRQPLSYPHAGGHLPRQHLANRY
ncbi:hypothetical protein SDC9_170585 [bioreactor metagenome]|uniref:Uncharacterized protein n=1 Tax=bioreactor metagenome TaxID=1076179 RepID=A0A645G8G9_9ZZZZ